MLHDDGRIGKGGCSMAVDEITVESEAGAGHEQGGRCLVATSTRSEADKDQKTVLQGCVRR